MSSGTSVVSGVMVCGLLACVAAGQASQFTGVYRNRDYGYTVTIPAGLAGRNLAPPAPQHGFDVDLDAAGARLLVSAEFDARLTFSVDAIASDWIAEAQRREPRLRMSSQKRVTLDGLDAVETVFDAEPGSAVAHARHVLALRPQIGGVGIVYALVLEQPARAKPADDAFARIGTTFRMTDISRGTSPDGSRLLQQQMAVVGCWLAGSWAADALRDVGLRVGDTIDVKFGSGHIDGWGGDAVSDEQHLQALLLAPGGKTGYLIMGVREPDGRTTVGGANTYSLSREGAHWSAGEGHGGIATYRAMGRYADKLDKEPATSIPLQPAAAQRCAR